MSDEHSVFTLGTLHMLKSPLHEVEVMYRHQVVKKSIRDVWRFRSCVYNADGLPSIPPCRASV